MRHVVAHIDIEGARRALALDAQKTPEQIRTIADKRGMEALAAIDAAMVRHDFGADSVGASLEAVRLQNDPSIFEVQGLKYQGAMLAGGFDWEVN
jgi:hypothetical protein